MDNKGADLSKTTEFLSFYALPYIKDVKSHQAFSEIMTDTWVDALREKVMAFVERVNSADEFYEKKPKEESSFLEEVIRTYKKRTSAEDSRAIARLTKDLEAANYQKELLLKEVETLQNQVATMHHEEHGASHTESHANVVTVHEKWISFSSDTLLLAKKILGFAETTVKGKADKIQIDEYRENIHSFESFLKMSREDLQSLKLKNVGCGEAELTDHCSTARHEEDQGCPGHRQERKSLLCTPASFEMESHEDGQWSS